ncbi:unnamed protein product [Meganyctiphanes norvegica]|uniref:Protein kinase domain-containing protein n=1 Tax=Meganyctiphanes norvegica TaxID=48144 RepID=A0AAV2PQC8_MEGNR
MVQQRMSDNMLSTSACSRLQEEAREGRRRRKKKRSGSSLVASHFLDLYKLTGEVLGSGSCGSVQVCRSIYTSEEYAVKIITKEPNLCRSKVFNEIEMMHYCQGHNVIIQLIEYFEEDDAFYLVFEKANGGTLLSRLHKNFRFTEQEASMIMQDLSSALDFLHQKGIAHRDIKLENTLCVYPDQVYPVKICDFDLASDSEASGCDSETTPNLYTPVGTAEYMAPEVVRGYSSFDNDPYDKRCDLWSLGISLYYMLCGYLPFTGDCGFDNCKWDLGGDCQACQELLFESISNCTFDFPEKEWADISDDAKNLIKQLLVEEPTQRLPANMILEDPWVISGGLPSEDSKQDVSEECPKKTNCDMPFVRSSPIQIPMEMTASMENNWFDRSPIDIDFEVSPNQADACDNCREKSKTVLWDIPRKSQSRSSIENWLDHSYHEEDSRRSTPKINLNEVKTQRLLVYFDTRMKMYELMKEKFQIGSSESEYFMYDLCLMERFRLSPPS